MSVKLFPVQWSMQLLLLLLKYVTWLMKYDDDTFLFLFHKACRMRKMEKIKKVGKRRNERRILSSLLRQVKKKSLEVKHYGWRVTWFVTLCRPPRRFCLTVSFLTAICHLHEVSGSHGYWTVDFLSLRVFLFRIMPGGVSWPLGPTGRLYLARAKKKSCTTWHSVRNQISISVA
jgi:hypothetical protein